MSKIYVWPDASYLDADEYNEVEFNHKGEDLITIDLRDIVEGRTALVYTGGLTVEPVLKDRLSELLQVEHQFKALTSMFRNYRNTMREMTWQIPQLRETIDALQVDYALALRRITELEASPPSSSSSESWELLEENRRLKSRLAEWKGRAEAAEAELAKLKRTAAIAIATLQEIE